MFGEEIFGMPADLVVQLIALLSALLSGVLAIALALVNRKGKRLENDAVKLNGQIKDMENKHQAEMSRIETDFNRDMRMFSLLEAQIQTTQSQSNNIEKLANATREQTRVQADAQVSMREAFDKVTSVIEINEARYRTLDEHVSKMDDLSLNVIEKSSLVANKAQKLIDTLNNELSLLKTHCSDEVRVELNAVERRIRDDIKNLLSEVSSINKSEDEGNEHESVVVGDGIGLADGGNDKSRDGTGSD